MRKPLRARNEKLPETFSQPYKETFWFRVPRRDKAKAVLREIEPMRRSVQSWRFNAVAPATNFGVGFLSHQGATQFPH
jgi:hypothetical protein